jgi:hypothetical protein
MYTLDQLNTRKASETPCEFELMMDGIPTGVFLSVIGQQSETFTTTAAKIAAEFELAKGLEHAVDFVASERSKEMTNRLVAARVIAWRGIGEPCTPENVLTLVATNSDAFTQILQRSNRVSNFIKL